MLYRFFSTALVFDVCVCVCVYLFKLKYSVVFSSLNGVCKLLRIVLFMREKMFHL